MQQAKPHTDTFGRVMGTLILLAGIGMLIGAFYTANTWFQSPLKGLEFLGTKSQVAPPPAALGAAALEFVRELVILGFMTMIGSIMAGKGIALYLGAIHWGESPRGTKLSTVDPGSSPAASKADASQSNAAL